jgi:aryl-phospho-beta-D-glucosidase BglC (GH1 family)
MMPPFGTLSVDNRGIVGQDGNPVQLRGVSSHGLQWFPQFVNIEAFRTVRDRWRANVVRLAAYPEGPGQPGWTQDPTEMRKTLFRGIEAAISLGLYVIVDWHVSYDQTPLKHADAALGFFNEVQTHFGDVPHLIFELCNEPNGQGDDFERQILPYVLRAIAQIRKRSPDALIVVGSGDWSKRPDQAYAAMPDAVSHNVLYTYHRYCDHNTQDWMPYILGLRDRGVPIFATECGLSDFSGDGPCYPAEFGQILDFYKRNNISWCAWSLCDKNEGSALLRPGAPINGAWQDGDLSQAGWLVAAALEAGH